MLELFVRLELERQSLRRRILSRFAGVGQPCYAMAGAVLLLSLGTFLFLPAAPMGLAGLITVGELAFLGVVLAISVVAAPAALILF